MKTLSLTALALTPVLALAAPKSEPAPADDAADKAPLVCEVGDDDVDPPTAETMYCPDDSFGSWTVCWPVSNAPGFSADDCPVATVTLDTCLTM